MTSSEPTATPRERRAPALSPSRLNDYQQCPLLFRLRTIDRIPEVPSSAAARGTLVHTVLEGIFDVPAGERTPEHALGLLPRAWDDLRRRRPEYASMFDDEAATEAWLGSARALVERYFTLENPMRLEPRARELTLEAQLEDGPLLRGIVDRIDVAPDGAVRIVDYKTGKAPRPQYGESVAFQMRFYALVVLLTRGTMPAMLQLVFLGDGQVQRSVPTTGDLERTETKIRSLWDSIVRDAREGSFAPRTSKLCDWCAHKTLCPAFGGTSPVFPAESVGLRLGISDEPRG
ncbi:RecB family exonuclease [Sanguibacter sp. A247]|uniref:RecB family exonuclease n=1 Tax=unclassified Sanguibacter TaxID=2645534 RepID=UPI003FD74E97